MDGSIIFVWILFAILVGVLATKNGRSGVLAFIFSIILSPLVGFILYLILGQSDLARANRAIADEQLIASIRAEKASDRFVPKSEQENDLLWVIIGLVVLAVLLVIYSMTLN